MHRYDYLRITDGSTYYTIGTYCGYQTGKRVRVDGSVAVLTFHSDGSIQLGGFYLSFSFFPQPRGECNNFNWLLSQKGQSRVLLEMKGEFADWAADS